MRKLLVLQFFALATVLAAPAARADLYAATQAYQNKEYEKSFALYRELAELGQLEAQAGLPTAQFMVGYSSMMGWGCECSEPKGLVWLHKAAAADQADAQVMLANYILRGEPTPEETAKAMTWLERAVASGNRDGKFYLAALLAAGVDAGRHDPGRALKVLKDVMRDVDDDPTAFEIRAAAHAMLGDFEEALKDQKRALKMAQKLGWETASQQQRLAQYSSGRAWTGDLFAF